ncbi:MAG: DUF1552 domain-containing protein [Pedosphaera sp.]|nr:DUF1552 domain-containing protein [Pedosphaera sp.]
MNLTTRRRFLGNAGLSASLLPFITGLPSLQARSTPVKQRIVFIFTPNGIVPPDFWPDETGANFTLKRILEPLAPFQKKTLILQGRSNRVRGDGDGHMRGMSCLLTGIELFPGNIQGGSDTPAGWASGPSIDQEVAQFLQSNPQTRTRFGSLELGVAVPNKADPWTRWTYAGANQPVAPISDPYAVFERLYGQVKDRENLSSILDSLRQDLRRLSGKLGREDKVLLEQHVTFVRAMEGDLAEANRQKLHQPAPRLEAGVGTDNEAMPKASALQIELLVNAFANDLCRVASLQYTSSVGQARMRWLGIDEGHHSLSHDPDLNTGSQEKLVKINRWFCEQVAGLASRLAATPEPGGTGSMLDHTTLLWTNELGKGNSHSHDNIPFVLVGGGLGFNMGQSLNLSGTPHNRLWLSIAHAFGHQTKTFGKPSLCKAGPLSLS